MRPFSILFMMSMITLTVADNFRSCCKPLNQSNDIWEALVHIKDMAYCIPSMKLREKALTFVNQTIDAGMDASDGRIVLIELNRFMRICNTYSRRSK